MIIVPLHLVVMEDVPLLDINMKSLYNSVLLKWILYHRVVLCMGNWVYVVNTFS